MLQVRLHPGLLGIRAYLPPLPGYQAAGRKPTLGYSAGSRWQRPGCPWLCPLPPPSHPRTRLGRCPGCRTLTPGSVGYSHHCWLCALAAGFVGRGDEAAWDAAVRVAEAAGHGDVVCGGRETAPVRPPLWQRLYLGIPGDSPSPVLYAPGTHPGSLYP